MGDQRKPLAYSDFIKVLLLLECCIPAFPQEHDREFLIFRWGVDGYAKRPNGPRAPFIHRERDTPVTELEVRKTLRILDISEAAFWQTVDNCIVELSKPQTLGPRQPVVDPPSDPNSAPKK